MESAQRSLAELKGSKAEKDTLENLNGRLNMNESMVAFLSLFIDSLLSTKRTLSNDRNQKITFYFLTDCFGDAPSQFTRFFRFRSYSSKHKQSRIHDFYDLTIFFEFSLKARK